ncbi:zinc finger CCCH domain-containing protein [Salix suchowensis]|nr:zinc finger CCCH domain-containing protein [Salix suchowensis]
MAKAEPSSIFRSPVIVKKKARRRGANKPAQDAEKTGSSFQIRMSLMKRRMESGWEGFKIEESGKKSENFHANYSSEKVGDGVDNNNERSNDNVHQYLVRLEAKDRAFCVKIETCKFGANCKFNHPIRRKNRTLTHPVDLLVCMRAIKNNAFQASEYPVVITFDDRLPANLQAKVAEAPHFERRNSRRRCCSSQQKR